MNTAKFIGNVGKEPVIIDLPSGEIMARFNVATSETFVNKAGEQQTKTEWHQIVAWGKTAQAVKDFVHKGTCVGIKARAVNNIYDKVIDVPVGKNKVVKHTIKVFGTEYQAYDIHKY